MLETAELRVSNRGPGILVEFRPFTPLSETLALKRAAIELWEGVKRPDSLAFVVIRATDRQPGVQGFQRVHAYGFIFERRSDGQWYITDDSLTVTQRAARLSRAGHR